METATVEGLTFGWTDTGAGRTILLIHAGGFGAWFDPIAGLLRDRVISMRRTGYAGASAATRPVAIGEHAAHAAALLDRLEAGPAVVVGHSSGSVIALQLALDHPALVSRLVLCEPPLIEPLVQPLFEPEEAAAVRAAIGPRIGAALGAAATGDVARALDMFLTAVCGPDYRTTVADALGPDWHHQAERDAAFFFANELPALIAWSAGALSQVSVPTLLVKGADSPGPTGRLIARLATTLPNATVATIPGANHLLPLSHPRDLADLVENVASLTE